MERCVDFITELETGESRYQLVLKLSEVEVRIDKE
jgi:hypothetical protein